MEKRALSIFIFLEIIGFFIFSYVKKRLEQIASGEGAKSYEGDEKETWDKLDKILNRMDTEMEERASLRRWR